MHGRAFVAFALSERSVDHCIRAGFLSQLLDRGRRNGAAAFNSVEAGIYDDHETELGPRPWRTLGARRLTQIRATCAGQQATFPSHL
jgi:hypothetical protein